MTHSFTEGTATCNQYAFSNFHVPFKTMIVVAKHDAVIMMEDATLEVVKNRNLGEKRKNNDAGTTTTNNK